MQEQRLVFQPAPLRALPDTDRLRITPRHFAYLKISEGCDRLCTFCAIPKMRGKHASKPIEAVVAEAQQLAADGVRELIVVAQDTTYYGMDLYRQPRLRELLLALEEVDVDWIRLMYFYPMYIDDALIDTIARVQRRFCRTSICRCSTLMIRCCDACLVASRGSETEELLDRLRQRIPGDWHSARRSSPVFPARRKRRSRNWPNSCSQQRFERLGVFTYSYEESTPSAALEGHLPEEVQAATPCATDGNSTADYDSSRIGPRSARRRQVLIDRAVPDQQGVWIGRTHGRRSRYRRTGVRHRERRASACTPGR